MGSLSKAAADLAPDSGGHGQQCCLLLWRTGDEMGKTNFDSGRETAHCARGGGR